MLVVVVVDRLTPQVDLAVLVGAEEEGHQSALPGVLMGLIILAVGEVEAAPIKARQLTATEVKGEMVL
jgi:hypothetical protein